MASAAVRVEQHGTRPAARPAINRSARPRFRSAGAEPRRPAVPQLEREDRRAEDEAQSVEDDDRQAADHEAVDGPQHEGRNGDDVHPLGDRLRVALLPGLETCGTKLDVDSSPRSCPARRQPALHRSLLAQPAMNRRPGDVPSPGGPLDGAAPSGTPRRDRPPAILRPRRPQARLRRHRGLVLRLAFPADGARGAGARPRRSRWSRGCATTAPSSRRRAPGSIPLEAERRSLNPMAAGYAAGQLAAILQAEKPDIVHCIALRAILVGGVAAAMAGIERRVYALTGLGFLGARTDRRGRLALQRGPAPACAASRRPRHALPVREPGRPALARPRSRPTSRG